MPSLLRTLSVAAVAALCIVSATAAEKKTKAKSTPRPPAPPAPKSAAAPATPTPAPPAAVPETAAPAAASGAATGKWVAVLSDAEFLDANPTIKRGPDGASITGSTILLQKPVKDCGVRFSFDAARRPAIQVSVRNSGEGQTWLAISDRGISLRQFDAQTKQQRALIEPVLPSAESGEVEVELRAVGHTLTLTMGGVTKQAEDPQVREGQVIISATRDNAESGSEPKLKKLEYIVLDK